MRSSLLATITTAVLGAIPSLTSAATPSAADRLQGVGSYAGFDQNRKLSVTVGQLIQGVLALLGVLCMSYLIYGGYTWLMARGDETQVEKAKETIKDAIIGVLIVLSAYVISAFVLSRFGAATGYRG